MFVDGQVVAVSNLTDAGTLLASFIGYESTTYVRVFLYDAQREAVVDRARLRPIMWPPAEA